MGIQKNIHVKGTWGNAVFYELNGKGIIRSRPANIKQSNTSRASAALFGKASQLGRLIRQQLRPYLPLKLGKQFHYALERALRAALSSNWNVLAGFEMNQGCPLMDSWHMPLSFSRLNGEMVSITLPAMCPLEDIKAPIGTTGVQMQLVAMHICYKQPTIINAHETAYGFPYTADSWQGASWQISFPKEAAAVLLVALQLRFLHANEQNPSPQIHGYPLAFIEAWADSISWNP